MIYKNLIYKLGKMDTCCLSNAHIVPIYKGMPTSIPFIVNMPLDQLHVNCNYININITHSNYIEICKYLCINFKEITCKLYDIALTHKWLTEYIDRTKQYKLICIEHTYQHHSYIKVDPRFYRKSHGYLVPTNATMFTCYGYMIFSNKHDVTIGFYTTCYNDKGMPYQLYTHVFKKVKSIVRALKNHIYTYHVTNNISFSQPRRIYQPIMMHMYYYDRQVSLMGINTYVTPIKSNAKQITRTISKKMKKYMT